MDTALLSDVLRVKRSIDGLKALDPRSEAECKAVRDSLGQAYDRAAFLLACLGIQVRDQAASVAQVTRTDSTQLGVSTFSGMVSPLGRDERGYCIDDVSDAPLVSLCECTIPPKVVRHPTDRRSPQQFSRPT